MWDDSQLLAKALLDVAVQALWQHQLCARLFCQEQVFFQKADLIFFFLEELWSVL